MDTSKEYIEMCRKAVDVMGLWDSDVINWRNQGYSTKHECLVVEGQDGTAMCPKLSLLLFKKEREQYKKEFCEFEHWIPLFYQDQLQGMVERSLSVKSNGNHMAVQFAYFVSDHIENHIHFGDVLLQSMEQLWLAFVMHEKFQKKWDGEDWIGI